MNGIRLQWVALVACPPVFRVYPGAPSSGSKGGERISPVLWACLGAMLIGCDATPKQAIKYPEGTIRLRYESAESYSTCMVASVAMAANHLLGTRYFSENGIRTALKRQGRDETLVADVKAFLEDEGLHLVTLQGRLDGKPPLRLGYWVRLRGYPAICVVNRHPGGEPGFNHAVVVIGISENPEDGSADTIHYFDPATAEPLHSDPAAVFDTIWGQCQRAMMIVVAPPTD